MEGSLPCSLFAAGVKRQLTSSYRNSLRPAQKSGASHHMAPEGEDLFLLTLVWGLSAQVTYSVQRRPLPRGQSMTLSWETLSLPAGDWLCCPSLWAVVLGPHRRASDTLYSPGFGIPGDGWAAQNVGFSQPTSVHCQFYIQFEVKTGFHSGINCSWPTHRKLHITSGQAIIWGSLKPYWEHVHFSQLRYKSYRHSSARKWQLHIPKKNT